MPRQFLCTNAIRSPSPLRPHSVPTPSPLRPRTPTAQAAGLDSATTAAQVAAIRYSQEPYQNPLEFTISGTAHPALPLMVSWNNGIVVLYHNPTTTPAVTKI